MAPLNKVPDMNAHDTAETLTEAECTLLHLLKPLASHYLDSTVEEIAISTPHLIFCRLRDPGPDGNIWSPRKDIRLTDAYLKAVITMFANTYDKPFHPVTQPTVHGSIPVGDPDTRRKDPSPGHRLAAAAGPQVAYSTNTESGGFALSIRQAPPAIAHDLGAWGIKPTDTHESYVSRHKPMIASPFTASDDPLIPRILKAAESGSLLLSGATGTGKTSMFRLLLDQLSPSMRYICIEDTREITIRHPNRVHFILHRDAEDTGLTPDRLRNVVTRFSPDIVVVGEISPGNARLALELLATGHSHFWTTIHASDPVEAFHQFAKLAHRSGDSDRPDQIASTLAARMACIQTSRFADGAPSASRHVSDIRWPSPL